MDKIALIIGHANLDIEIPIRVMESEDKAHEFLRSLGLVLEDGLYSLGNKMDDTQKVRNAEWAVVQRKAIACPDCPTIHVFDRRYCAVHEQEMAEVFQKKTLEELLFQQRSPSGPQCEYLSVQSASFDEPFYHWYVG